MRETHASGITHLHASSIRYLLQDEDEDLDDLDDDLDDEDLDDEDDGDEDDEEEEGWQVGASHVSTPI
jgi:hypothetical protein